MPTFSRILCPVDFSANSLRALDQAAALARRHHALLDLMNVEFVPLNNPADLEDYVAVSTEPGRAQLEQTAREHLAGVPHKLAVRVGLPSHEIEKAAEDLDVDLIVMATHGRTGVAHLFLGSVAEHVVREAKRPVLTFGPGASIGELKKILCPVDFDPNSQAALKFGWRLAQDYGARMVALHVVAVPFEPSEIPVVPVTPEWEEDARAQLQTMVDENLGPQAGCELLVRRGDPAGAILELARELRADLIVMATHGRTGLSHLVLGSVAERVVRESVAPVLTMREAHDVSPGVSPVARR